MYPVYIKILLSLTPYLNLHRMRTFVLFLVFSFSLALTQAQNPKKCQGPIPNEKFRQRLEMISSSNNEIQKLKKAKDLVTEHCLTSLQVKTVAELFINDFTRLDFAQVAFASVTDPENFYDVYDAFAYFSNVFRLHDFTKSMQSTALPPVPPPPPCFVSNEEFAQVKESINKQSFNATKVTIAKQVIQAKQCFTALQIRDILKLFSFEESKLELAKFAYDFCTNKRDYFQVNDAFTYSNSVEELSKYISTKH